MRPRRTTTVAVALAALLALVPGTSPVAMAEPMDGVVTGIVSNRTAGGSGVGGDVVTLYGFDVDQQSQTSEESTTVDAAGGFRFEGLDRGNRVAYLVVVQHDGVRYPAPTPFQFGQKPLYRAEVTVFDATTSDAAIRFDRLNLVVNGVDGGLLQVLQMGSVVNSGDRTYVTRNPLDRAMAQALRFGLPRGAVGVQVAAGFRQSELIDGVGGVQVTTPLKPGSQEFAFAFQVPYLGSSADLTMQVPYPTLEFNLYAPGGGPTFEGGRLTGRGRADMGGQAFERYGATNLERGAVLEARLGALPWAGGTGLAPEQLALLSLGLVLLVLALGLTLFGWRLRSARTAEIPRPVADAPPTEQERLQLVLKLAALDDRYAAGKLAEDHYRAQRTQEKQRLLELTRTLRGDTRSA